MNEYDKELFVNTLKLSFRINYPKDEADKLCDRLDKAKKNADTLEQIFCMYQQSWQQFARAFMNMSLPK